MAFQATRWNALPEPGGLLDQPAGLMERMNYAHNVHEAFSMFHNKQGVRLAKVSPAMFDLVMHYLYEDD